MVRFFGILCEDNKTIQTLDCFQTKMSLNWKKMKISFWVTSQILNTERISVKIPNFVSNFVLINVPCRLPFLCRIWFRHDLSDNWTIMECEREIDDVVRKKCLSTPTKRSGETNELPPQKKKRTRLHKETQTILPLDKQVISTFPREFTPKCSGKVGHILGRNWKWVVDQQRRLVKKNYFISIEDSSQRFTSSQG